MSDMVEKVARAIWDSTEIEPWDAVPDTTKHMCRHVARAAIEAMRPTSNAMDFAGAVHLRLYPSDASGCFEAMIDAALKGEAE